MKIRYLEYVSPLGTLLICAGDKGLRGVYFEQHQYFKGPQDWIRDLRHPQLLQAASQIDEYFAGRRKDFDLPLDPCGTPFQRAVWDALLALPFGQTTSYGAIAAKLARVRAVRAVGAAIGRNPLSIIIPCHRVLGANGDLSGYAGGLERKRYLLDHEQRRENMQAA